MKKEVVKKALMAGLIITTLSLVVAIVSAIQVYSGWISVEAAEGETVEEPGVGKGLAWLGAGIAIGVAGFGAGIGMGTAAAAAVGAVAERPEIFGRTVLYVVFIEAIAIYAMVVALLLIMSF